MPSYKYNCGRCGSFTVKQRYEDKLLSKCVCGRPVKQEYSAPLIIYKGTGWAQ